MRNGGNKYTLEAPKRKKKIQPMTHRYWKRDSIVTSETAIQWNRVHKPGGTGMIIIQPIKIPLQMKVKTRLTWADGLIVL